MNTHPYWFKLLYYQRIRGKTGLTIPFLIGADSPKVARPKISETEAYGELAGILVCLRDQVPSSHSVVIKKCDDIHVPIVALHPPEHGLLVDSCS